MSQTHIKYSLSDITEIYNQPLLELIFRAASVHRKYHDPSKIQVSSLLSIKTGGCSEDCSYCPQSIKYNTDLKVEPLMALNEVVEKAKQAKANGASRFCMGAAWREVRDNKDFDRVLEMVREVNEMGMQVCATLGMLTESQAKRLEEAGLYAYNHNLDSSEEYYTEIIGTRMYEDRLKTLENVRKTNMTVCCGGILGMGETDADRIKLLHTLQNMEKPPESVPINVLVPVEGTPLAEQSRVSTWDFVRMVATARIIMPESFVRLSAGRLEMPLEAQALCFLAGANSIFSGDKLLTTPNPDSGTDQAMFQLFGLQPLEPAEITTTVDTI